MRLFGPAGSNSSDGSVKLPPDDTGGRSTSGGSLSCFFYLMRCLGRVTEGRGVSGGWWQIVRRGRK
ncbi:hypothetical protein E2C01_067956 [Portunus trituberculatus]|uniref:Uncharacterized protein n=1 Tax=Portunus trituberculatus TaxID=210409 RepID=A0A5B7HL80_PORTR|nr:hypothetical protein [Portunus trituberculatus]